MDLRAVICESGEKLGYKSLKDKQVEAVCSFTEGNDVFVSLPTGYGKSTDQVTCTAPEVKILSDNFQ